jgi:ATP-dependent DNA helicase RecG
VERNEYSRYEQKSLKAAVGKSKDLNMLAERVVPFANAQGGDLVIGIEDGEEAPPPDQVIDETTAGGIYACVFCLR